MCVRYVGVAPRNERVQERLGILSGGDVRTRGLDEASSVAVVRVRIVGSYDGAGFEGDFRYTRVWHRDPGGWRVVAAHCSAVA